MKRFSLIFIGLLLVPFWNGAQNTITFYKHHQLGKEGSIEGVYFFDARIEGNGKQFVLLGDYHVGPMLTNRKFFIATYDSLGNILNAYNFPHEFGKTHSEVGEAKIFSTGEIFLDYGESYFLDTSRKVIWKNSKDTYISNLTQIDDSTFAGINKAGGTSKICKLDYNGKLQWQVADTALFPTNGFIRKYIFTTDSAIIYAQHGFFGTWAHHRLYYAMFSFSGKLIKKDSLIFDSLLIYNFCFTKNNNYIIDAEKYKGGMGRLMHLMVYDTQKVILYEKSSITDLFGIMDMYSNNKNSYVLMDRSKNSKDTVIYEILKFGSKGELNNIIKSKVKNRDLILDKLFPLTNESFLLLGGLNRSAMSTKEFSGIFMKIDSNGYAEGGTYSSFQKPKYLYGEVAVFPNPLTTTTTFTLPTLPGQKAEFKLYNITGKLVKQEAFTGNFFQLTRGNLPTGMYLYHISAGEKVFTGKVLVER